MTTKQNIIVTHTFSGLLDKLSGELKGELYTDLTTRLLYATDASIYRVIPKAVARPANIADIKKLVTFAGRNNISLIPRTAGTSLAGQVVGDGIVVDLSKHFTRILEINEQERWVRVQPGVILDELNAKLTETGLFFGPETSTSNRCMIGGMVGNNACGSHSLIYGSTRDHLISVKAILSDGSEAEFGPLHDASELDNKVAVQNLEGRIYKMIHEMISDGENQQEIRNGYPEPGVRRRNTGYALDQLMQMQPYRPDGPPFNLSVLLAGSEGTLAFITEIKLNLIPLPPPVKGLVCVHLHTLEEALEANLVCLEHKPGAVELMDHTILECTRSNIEQRKNRFFLHGEPGALLIVEFTGEKEEEVRNKKAKLESDLRERGLGYHYPLITGDDINKVWALRKSGLGVLSNIPGDAKPVSLIEDTAVSPEKLPHYIHDIKMLFAELGLDCVFHAHVGTGELHMRPMIDLTSSSGRKLMHNLSEEVARLVKKYRGSLSGEHGDGRLRSQFIPLIVGERNYEMMRVVKKTFDPSCIFNPGKIIDSPHLDTDIRYVRADEGHAFRTVFDYSPASDMLQHAGMCNGSGDCRKPFSMGGTMCPSYMASLDEHTSTRARANILREYLSNRCQPGAIDAHEVYRILDLCLSCKGCKSECPSSVDMAKLKAEFLQHYYDIQGVPLRNWLISHMTVFYGIASHFPEFFNFLIRSRWTRWVARWLLGFSGSRDLPELSAQSLDRWIRQRRRQEKAREAAQDQQKRVYLFLDEFTNYLEAKTGMAAYLLLSSLGYQVMTLKHRESGRTFISKGMLRKAREIARSNVRTLSPLISDHTPLIGIEPSSLLTFRDEYIDLLSGELKEQARELSRHTLLLEEFIAEEFKAGRIDRDRFKQDRKHILLHGHCQQKAIASTRSTHIMLSIPEGYSVEEIGSGCCGMAGSFGYEKEHKEMSMRIGELVLFPAVRKADDQTIICANGTSCRQQILDGTGRKAFHPAEILFEALKI